VRRVGGVGDVAADGRPGGSGLGRVGVQLLLVVVEHGDRVPGTGERADQRDAEARSDADDDRGPRVTAMLS
jgi:hypothetical protein